MQHPFTDWLEVLTDRRAPLAVSPAQPPPGATGACYSVESTSASLNAPLDVGIYCYDPDGTPTAVRTATGTLVLAGAAGPAPATVTLAGPVTEGEPLEVAAPAADEPSASARPGGNEQGGNEQGGNEQGGNEQGGGQPSPAGPETP